MVRATAAPAMANALTGAVAPVQATALCMNAYQAFVRTSTIHVALVMPVSAIAVSALLHRDVLLSRNEA